MWVFHITSAQSRMFAAACLGRKACRKKASQTHKGSSMRKWIETEALVQVHAWIRQLDAPSFHLVIVDSNAVPCVQQLSLGGRGEQH